MLKFLARCMMFIVGLVLIAETGLPTRAEQLRVDRHSSSFKSDHRGAGAGDTSYTLHLIDGAVSTCSVGYALYSRLQDGDSVEVRSTRLFKNCIRISQGDEVLEDDRHWKYIALAFGALLIAGALGLLPRSDDDERSGIAIRLG
ncbi:MAG: hypothetical protein EOP35_01775 [Rubrivivax sp.]|nr:MAG: hypothetical protein EOP35_01775 [Rubrivivax sp.]